MAVRRTPLIALALAVLAPLSACARNDGSVDQNGYEAGVYLARGGLRVIPPEGL